MALLKPRSAFSGGPPRRNAERERRSGGMAGEPKPFTGAKRKQKTAVLQGAATRLLFSRQAKQCPRDHGAD